MKTGRLLPVLLCAAIAGASVVTASCMRRGPDERERQDVLLPRDVDVLEARVPRNATLEGLLRSHEASSGLADSIVGPVRSQFNPRSLKADQPYHLITSLDGLFREFRYTLDADRFLRVALRAGSPPDAPQFDVEVVPYPKEVIVDAVEVSITKARPSLWAALEDSGENIQLALLLSDAF